MNLTKAETAARSAVVSDVRYDVLLDLDAERDTFGSRSTVTFTARAAAATFLDTPDGRVPLSDLNTRNERVHDTRASYSRTGLGLCRATDPADGATYIYGQFQPDHAHHAFACFDQPDLKAPASIDIHAPDGWAVFGGRADTPVPTYACGIAAGPFHRTGSSHRGTQVAVACRRTMADLLDATHVIGLITAALDVYTELFATPFPYPSLDVVFVPGLATGGMENVGCVTLDDTRLRDRRYVTVLLHEIAHMWFGNLVTPPWWDELWLFEAFATHWSHVALAAITGDPHTVRARSCRVGKAHAYADDQRPSAHPLVVDVETDSAALAVFDDITYVKGASLLGQLEQQVGPDAFLAGIRRFLDAHRHATAGFAELLDATAPELAVWAKPWLTGTGVGTLCPQPTVDARRRYTGFTLVDRHPQVAQRTRVGLYSWAGGQLTRTQQVAVDVDGPATPVPQLVGAPAADLVLVNDDDIAYTTIRFDARSLRTLMGGLSRLTSPLTRALCWSALWDMTRAAELPASTWVRLVAAHAHVEHEPDVLRDLLRDGLHAADRFAADRSSARAVLAGAARQHSSHQHTAPAWLQHRVAADPDPTFAAAQLAATADPARRWPIVLRLAALGAITAGDIDAELRADPDAAPRAYAAHAALPDPTSKARWFSAAVNGDMPPPSRLAILDGFWRVETADLVTGTDWAGAMRTVWNNTAAEVRPALVAALFPACRPTPRILADADALLSRTIPPTVRSIVEDGRDEVRRALSAQDADR